MSVAVTPADVDALAEVAALLAVMARRPRVSDTPTPYLHDPLGWLDAHVTWRLGEGLTAYQREVIGALLTRRRVAVRGPHGLGKTAMAALIVLWFAVTRDAAGLDWKVVTTASAWRQLTKFLWPEVHKWSSRLRWDLLGREPFSRRTELLAVSLKLGHGEAFAVASDQPALIEGAHADHLLYVFDEGKAIIPDTFDAAEGAFSGAGSDTGNEAYALAISTPGEPTGRFYDIHKRTPGYEDWWVRHVTLAETIAAGRVSQQWANQRQRQWGEASAVYQNRVLGEFAASDEDGVIPLGWVEAANQRWQEWDDAGRPGVFTAVGVDVARMGEDKTVLALRYEQTIAELRRYARQDTTATMGRVKGVLDAHGGRAVIDVIGIGAGVVDHLREQGYGSQVIAFNASERAVSGGHEIKDRSGELGFTNKRGAAWWQLREILDPSHEQPIALPPDDLLIGDLTAPHWRVMSGGKVQVESKDDIKARLGRSTDDGDAVVMAFFDTGPPAAGTIIQREPVMSRPRATIWR